MIENVLRSILEISLFASIMIGVCLLIRLLVSGRVMQRYLMILWAVILLRLIVPFTIESPVSIADAFQSKILTKAETDTAINDLSFLDDFTDTTVNQSNIERPVQIDNVTNTTIQESNSTQVVNACQLTQDEEESKLIESDSDNKTIKKQVSNEFPKSWEEKFSIDSGRINVDINTSVNVSNTDSYAIVQAEPIAFKQDQVDQFRKYFIGDATLVSEPKEVKSDFDEAIAEMEKGIKDFDENSPQEKEMIESMQGIIEEYKRKRELAPETSEPYEIKDFTLSDEEIVGDFSLDNGLKGWMLLDKSRFTYFTSKAGLPKV